MEGRGGDGWMDGWTGEEMDGRTERDEGRRMDGREEGGMDGCMMVDEREGGMMDG